MIALPTSITPPSLLEVKDAKNTHLYTGEACFTTTQRPVDHESVRRLCVCCCFNDVHVSSVYVFKDLLKSHFFKKKYRKKNTFRFFCEIVFVTETGQSRKSL